MPRWQRVARVESPLRPYACSGSWSLNWTSCFDSAALSTFCLVAALLSITMAVVCKSLAALRGERCLKAKFTDMH